MRDYIQHVRVSFVWPLAVMLKNEPTVSGFIRSFQAADIFTSSSAKDRVNAVRVVRQRQ